MIRRFAVSASIAGALTAAWIIAQPQPPAVTGELAMPILSTPYTCSAGREGRIYYDSDNDTPYYCDPDTWTTFGVTISGTDNYIPIFNAAGDNIEDSIFSSAGYPTAGNSGNVFTMDTGMTAMNGADTLRLFYITPGNAAHTGATNSLRGFEMQAISSGGQANLEARAFMVNDGWDYAFWALGGGFEVNGTNPVAGASWRLVDIGRTLEAMDGSDSVNIIFGNNLNNANHTGTSNYLYYMFVGDITNDAQATETAIYVDAEWDSFLTTHAKSASWSAPNEPPTNMVAFYVDESVDRGSGAGTADCALIGRLSDGTEVVISVLVSDGGCP